MGIFSKVIRFKDPLYKYKIRISVLFFTLFLPLSYAETTPLYDFDHFFCEPHPFSEMSPFYKTQSLVSIHRSQLLSNPPHSAPNAQPRLGNDRRRESKELNTKLQPEIKSALSSLDTIMRIHDFYGGVSIIGSYSSIQDPSITNAGFLKVNNGKDSVFSLGFSFGYDWNKLLEVPVRSEIEYHYRVRMDFDSRDTRSNGTPGYENDLHSHVVLFNIYYDWKFNPRFALYGGGGLGAAKNTSAVDRVNLITGTKTSRSDQELAIAWNVGIGTLLKIQTLSNWIFDFRYRYIDLGKFSSGPHVGNETISVRKYFSHDFVMGAVYQF